LALLGRYVPLEAPSFARVCIGFTLLLSHSAVFLALRRIKVLSFGTALVVVLCWLHLTRTGLQGFYDAAWIVAGLLGLQALARKDDSALLWLSAATLLHFRAVVLLPLGMAALANAVWRKPAAQWPYLHLATSGAFTILSAATFILVAPSSSGFWEFPPLLESGQHVAITAVVASSFLAAVAGTKWDNPYTGAIVAITGILALIDLRYWWHGSMLLAAPLSVNFSGQARRPELARIVLVAWAVLLQALAWGGLPNAVIREIARVLRAA
jgi:hypothetical protein